MTSVSDNSIGIDLEGIEIGVQTETEVGINRAITKNGNKNRNHLIGIERNRSTTYMSRY